MSRRHSTSWNSDSGRGLREAAVDAVVGEELGNSSKSRQPMCVRCHEATEVKAARLVWRVPRPRVDGQ